MKLPLLRNNHLCLEDMFKCNYLFRGHVTKEQLKPVLMQPPLFRGQPELTITDISGTGRWNYLDLHKLKHRKLSLVCLGFSYINVPPKLRTCNLRIPIETGWWANIPRQERTCTFCNDNVGNEFHVPVFFMCNNDRIVNLRNIYSQKYYVQYPNITKMSGLLSLCNVQLYKRFTIFIKKVNALL
jgi:hypothetical protein